jgi:hypothetical protein
MSPKENAVSFVNAIRISKNVVKELSLAVIRQHTLERAGADRFVHADNAVAVLQPTTKPISEVPEVWEENPGGIG